MKTTINRIANFFRNAKRLAIYLAVTDDVQADLARVKERVKATEDMLDHVAMTQQGMDDMLEEMQEESTKFITEDGLDDCIECAVEGIDMTKHVDVDEVIEQIKSTTDSSDFVDEGEIVTNVIDEIDWDEVVQDTDLVDHIDFDVIADRVCERLHVMVVARDRV